MVSVKKLYKFTWGLKFWLLVIFIYVGASAIIRAFVPAPQAVGMLSPERPISDIRFLMIQAGWRRERDSYHKPCLMGLLTGFKRQLNLSSWICSCLISGKVP